MPGRALSTIVDLPVTNRNRFLLEAAKNKARAAGVMIFLKRLVSARAGEIESHSFGPGPAGTALGMVNRRLAIYCGRNVEAQVIVLDVFIDAGQRFEVVKIIFTNNGIQDTQSITKSQEIYLAKFFLKAAANGRVCWYCI